MSNTGRETVFITPGWSYPTHGIVQMNLHIAYSDYAWTEIVDYKEICDTYTIIYKKNINLFFGIHYQEVVDEDIVDIYFLLTSTKYKSENIKLLDVHLKMNQEWLLITFKNLLNITRESRQLLKDLLFHTIEKISIYNTILANMDDDPAGKLLVSRPLSSFSSSSIAAASNEQNMVLVQEQNLLVDSAGQVVVSQPRKMSVTTTSAANSPSKTPQQQHRRASNASNASSSSKVTAAASSPVR